ncbi:uncharacterized protein PF11_0213-like isoform X2 [Myzus persicae]|uniref:uncharacterized protein PF11_0213-like isoform X2 n=1 Tax=Myzus persicae TaxID=13164 RepID=UPI000B938FE6|nr:uncharacterized protein PF11_0213-like isoform X2 [Myzus persicae]
MKVRKNVRNSRVKLSPISETSQSSSKIMNRDIRKIESMIYQKEQPIVPSNLKISKEVTITSINHTNDTDNNIILKLKKLPGITIDLVKSEPVFKVPESPILKTNKDKKNISTQNKLKVLFEKKGLSVRRDDNIEAKHNLLSHNNINILNTNLNSRKTLRQKPKQTCNSISLLTRSSDKGILKNPEISFKKYSVSEKENVQRTSSPKKLSKKIQSSSKIKSKSSETIQMVEETSNNCKILYKEVNPAEKVSNDCNISSKEVKTISDKDIIINNIQLKTNELVNENYMLMDLSTDGKINIVHPYFPLDFIDGSVPEYDNFLSGISKSSKDSSSLLETSQNDTEKGSIVNKEELYNFSDFLGCINTSLNINESDDIHSKLASQSINNDNPLDNIKDNQLYTINKSKENMIEKFEDEQSHNSNFYFYNHTSKKPSLQHNDMKQMMDKSILLEDSQLSGKMTSYYCDSSIENMPENKNNLQDFKIPILPNNIKNSSNLNSNENENGTKRKYSQNDLSMCEKLKKQKI